MAGNIKYGPSGGLPAATTILDQTGSAPNTLASLAASGGGAILATGSAYDNTSGLYFWGDFEMRITFNVAPTAGQTMDLYLAPSLDGTTYGDLTGSNTPANVISPNNHWIGNAPVRAVTTEQVLYVRGVPLPPMKFIVMIVNNGGQVLKTSGTTQSLKMQPYNEQYT